MTPARKTAYALFGLLILAVFWLHLAPVALAGLFSYLVLDASHRRFSARLSPGLARLCSVTIFTVVAVGVGFLFARFVTLGLDRMPVILSDLIPRVYDLAASYGVSLPFENLHDLRAVLLEAVRDNAASITQASGLLTKGFFQIIVGICAAVLCFFSSRSAAPAGTFYSAVRAEFDGRMAIFMAGFQKILGAQVLLSLINTGLTAAYLTLVGMPYVHFLTLATFILGVIPVVGTFVTSAMIVGTALTISPKLALGTLVFLLFSHYGQYLLSGRIIGSRLKTPMWQILLGLLVGEAIMGVPGMILAPALIHHIREELRGLPEGLDDQADARRARATAR